MVEWYEDQFRKELISDSYNDALIKYQELVNFTGDYYDDDYPYNISLYGMWYN